MSGDTHRQLSLIATYLTHAEHTALHRNQHTVNNTTYTFKQLNAALTACTPYYLTRETDEDGNKAFALRDGCGDQDGDLFLDLFDVVDYICDNDDVSAALTNPVA